MLETLIHRKHDRVRLQSGPMAPHLVAFADTLTEEGYAARVVRRYVFAADVFGRWLDRHRLKLHDVDGGTLARYVEGLGRARAAGSPTPAPESASCSMSSGGTAWCPRRHEMISRATLTAG